MRRACGVYKEREMDRGFWWKFWKRETTWSPKRNLDIVITMDLKDIGWEGVDWIDLAQGTEKWRDVEVAVLYLRVSQNVENVFNC